MSAGVTATPAALEMIERLSAEHGPLALFQSGGCCDGSSPICLKNGELPPGPGDRLLGTIGGAPFYVDSEQYTRWREPGFLLDVRPGPAEGLSLGLPEKHLVTHSPAHAKPSPAADRGPAQEDRSQKSQSVHQ